MKLAMRSSWSLVAAAAWGMMVFASNASACATCYGQTDSPLGRGLTWGILALLTVVGGVIAGICSFFVFVARRASKLDAEDKKTLTASSSVDASPLKPV